MLYLQGDLIPCWPCVKILEYRVAMLVLGEAESDHVVDRVYAMMAIRVLQMSDWLE